uniref:Myelin basic protein n=1 Tax=Gadus morhua TaxID=8049 RepID=A0A8C5FT95_GADMO
MATTSSSGLSKKKKNTPGLMDQINTFFGGDKKKRSKGSFRGHLSTSPQGASARRKPNESAVAHFFRSFTASPRAESAKSPLRRRKDQSTLSRLFNMGETKARPPPKRWSTIF